MSHTSSQNNLTGTEAESKRIAHSGLLYNYTSSPLAPRKERGWGLKRDGFELIQLCQNLENEKEKQRCVEHPVLKRWWLPLNEWMWMCLVTFSLMFPSVFVFFFPQLYLRNFHLTSQQADLDFGSSPHHTLRGEQRVRKTNAGRGGRGT